MLISLRYADTFKKKRSVFLPSRYSNRCTLAIARYFLLCRTRGLGRLQNYARANRTLPAGNGISALS